VIANKKIEFVNLSRFVFLMVLLAAASFGQSDGKQEIGQGISVFFGQSLSEVERITRVTGRNVTLPIAREGIDKIVALKYVDLQFDTARLVSIEFKGDFTLPGPLSPFPEEWKNLYSIEGREMRLKMTRNDVWAYLKQWEDRAKTRGYQRKDSGDLNEKEYSITDTDEDAISMIHISMGPSRRTSKGGRWSDGWSFAFTSKAEARIFKTKTGRLDSIRAFRDEFNTAGRK
jgi:hypothetical protein